MPTHPQEPFSSAGTTAKNKIPKQSGAQWTPPFSVFEGQDVSWFAVHRGRIFDRLHGLKQRPRGLAGTFALAQAFGDLPDFPDLHGFTSGTLLSGWIDVSAYPGMDTGAALPMYPMVLSCLERLSM